MIAPRMIGVGVRETFLTNEGFFSFIHVHQDASGNSMEILLALSRAVGTLKKGAIDVTPPAYMFSFKLISEIMNKV